MYVWMYVCMYECMYAFMYVCMYVCMHVCMYVYILIDYGKGITGFLEQGPQGLGSQPNELPR